MRALLLANNATAANSSLAPPVAAQLVGRVAFGIAHNFIAPGRRARGAEAREASPVALQRLPLRGPLKRGRLHGGHHIGE
jgi:hypothetical protein